MIKHGPEMGPGGPKNEIVKFKAKADPWNKQKITTYRLVSGPVPKSHKVTKETKTLLQPDTKNFEK